MTQTTYFNPGQFLSGNYSLAAGSTSSLLFLKNDSFYGAPLCDYLSEPDGDSGCNPCLAGYYSVDVQGLCVPCGRILPVQ